MHEWHKSLLHEVVPPLIQKWARKLRVSVSGYFLQRMKTKWGGCSHAAKHIRLNTELVKKPKDLLEYVIVHEMVHLIEPTHSDRFTETQPPSDPYVVVIAPFSAPGTNHFAIRRRFWAVAAIKNSSCAPLIPRNLNRSGFSIRLRCAKSISTFFRSFRDCRYSGVALIARATFLAAS